MARHPVDGVKGSKPRISRVQGNGKVTKEGLSKLNREYLTSRNRGQLAKAEAIEIALAEKKGTLISRKLVGLQAAFLLTAFRQRVMSEPAVLASRLVQKGFLEEKRMHEAQEIIKGDLYAMLADLAELPSRITDPDWGQKIDGDLREQVDGAESRRERPMAPGEAKAQAAKARRRREAKTQTMRKARAG